MLPWAIDVEDAIKPGAPILHDHIKFQDKPSNIAGTLEHKKGDVEAGFKQADVIVERSFKTEAVHQGYIEPHACLVSVTDGKATIWSSSQGQFMVRAMSALLTGMTQSDIRAIPAEIGGGFGGKTIVYLEPLALVLARKTGKPVKMVMSREEVFRASGPTSGSMSKVKIGAKKDGTIVAAQGTYYLQAGAFPGSPIRGAAGCAFGPYDIENAHTVGFDVVSNRSKVAAYRAPGAPIGAYAVECVLDELAEKLGMDPLELRLKNSAKQGTKAVHGPVYPVMGYQETLKQAMAHPHYKAPLKPNQGRGVASGYWFNAGGESSAQMSINEDGSVVVMTGHPDIGGSPRLDGQHRRRASGHRPQQDPGADRRHQQHRLLEPDRRQPRHLRLRHGGHAGGGEGHHPAAPARGQDLEDRSRRRHLGQRRGQAGRRQCRQVRSAVAGPARRPGDRDRRADRRRRLDQHRRRRGRLQHAYLRRRGRPRHRPRLGDALHRLPGCRPGDPSRLCRGPDAGRRRPGHRLGAERGVHLRQERQAR